MKSETFHRMLDDYCQLLRSRTLAYNTERAYVSRITQFLIFVEKNGNPEKFLFEQSEVILMLEKYQHYLKELGSTVASMNATWTAIEQFLDHFGLERPSIDRDSVEGRSRKVISVSEQQRLLQALEKEALLQHRAILACFLSCGLRLGECSALDVENLTFDESGGAVAVGRGYIKRVLVLDPYATEALKAWLVERKFRSMAETGPLFVNHRGERLANSALDRIVRAIGRRAGLVISAQLLRRTYMHNLLSVVDNTHVVAALTGTRAHSFNAWSGVVSMG